MLGGDSTGEPVYPAMINEAIGEVEEGRLLDHRDDEQ